MGSKPGASTSTSSSSRGIGAAAAAAATNATVLVENAPPSSSAAAAAAAAADAAAVASPPEGSGESNSNSSNNDNDPHTCALHVGDLVRVSEEYVLLRLRKDGGGGARRRSLRCSLSSFSHAFPFPSFLLVTQGPTVLETFEGPGPLPGPGQVVGNHSDTVVGVAS
jgi:hypothetical protein